LPTTLPSHRLKVGLLLPNLRTGGAERQMMELALGLPKDRFAVEFLSMIGAGPLDDEVRAAGIEVRHVGARHLHTSGVLERGVGRARKIGAFVSEVRQRRYDVLDAWIYPLDALAVLTRPITRVPVVISGRRNMLPHESFRAASGLVDRVVRRGTDVVVANSEAAAAYAIAMHHTDPRRVRIIRNGVRRSGPASAAERLAARAAVGAAEDDVVVGCVANLRPEKRHDLLLAAFGRVLSERPALRLVLVGDGPCRSDIERQVVSLGIGPRVHLCGNVLDARPLYPALDIVVQASDTEGMPNAMLEAAAAGRAIVATAAGGTVEIVVDGDTGLLVPVGDLDALAQGIRRLATDQGLRTGLGAAARARAEEAFGMDRFIREFAELYQTLARPTGPS
jgi:glycosyltransferase involved in cell wall biosynthesis